MKRWLLLALMIAVPGVAAAQTTSVSGTITDAGAVVWKNGTFSFTFTPSPNNPTANYFQNGVPFNKFTTISGSLDATGSLTSVAVPDNLTIVPSGSTWATQVCPAATASNGCFKVQLTITGASQSITSSVIPPAISVNVINPGFYAAYADGEISGARQGSTYFNLTDATLHICNLPVCTWLSLASPTSILGLNNTFTGTNTDTQLHTFSGGISTTTTNSTGAGSHSGTETFTGPLQCKNVNNVRCVDEVNSAGWSGADVCAQIASAIGDLSSAGGVVDARGVLTARSCAGNPWSGVTKPITLLLPGLTFTLNAKWTIAANDVVVRGTGERATVLQAGIGLTNSAVVEMGDNLSVYFGMRLEDLRVHCGGNTGCTPILMRGLNEESGVRRVVLSDYRTNGIKVDGSVQNTGDFEISDSEISTAAGAGVAGDGIFINATQGQIKVVRISVVANNLQTSAAFHNTSATTNNFFGDNHAEKFTDAVVCDGGALHVSGTGGFSGTVNTLHVKTGCNGVSMINVLNNGNSNSNPVVLNDISGTNLSSINPPSPGGFISIYDFSAGWTEFWLDNNGLHFNSNSSSRALFDSGNLALGSFITNLTQTSTMGLALKKGSGVGNYTNATTSYAVADSTNLCFTVTIPLNWKLGISAQGALSTATAAVVAQAALTDNASCSTANAGILVETAPIQGAGIGIADTFALDWVITGDGASHNVALQFKTSNAADTVSLINSSATVVPTMKFELMPSN